MPQRRRRLKVELRAVHLARGHDGFLRGCPEPVLLFGAYSSKTCGAGAHLVDLGRVDLGVSGPFPSVITPTKSMLFSQLIPLQHDRILLLALALERDSGQDVASLLLSLSEPGLWSLWEQESFFPVPFDLEQASRYLNPSMPPASLRVRLCLQDKDLDEVCTRDNLVDAGLVVLGSEQRLTAVIPLRLVSANGRNDWTAMLWVQVK